MMFLLFAGRRWYPAGASGDLIAIKHSRAELEEDIRRIEATTTRSRICFHWWEIVVIHEDTRCTRERRYRDAPNTLNPSPEWETVPLEENPVGVDEFT